jgi:hypothetical protein
MTDATLSAPRFTEGDFRVGRVVSRSWSVLWRNFPKFLLVSAVAVMPQAASDTLGDPFHLLQIVGVKLDGFSTILGHVLTTLSEAAVLYGAFQDMGGQRVDLVESLRVGLRRFFPALGVAIVTTILGYLGLFVFVVPGLMFFTLAFVAIPACVVERRSVFASIGRSAELTRGHRWKIFALLLLCYGAAVIAESLLENMTVIAGTGAGFVAYVVWNGAWEAFYAICAVVAYHDLRVASEGVDTAQIAAVFE